MYSHLKNMIVSAVGISLLVGCSGGGSTASAEFDNTPIVPCSLADTRRIIAIASLGSETGYSVDFEMFFGKKAAENTINANAHFEATKHFKGYLASLVADGKITEAIMNKMIDKVHELDRCKV